MMGCDNNCINCHNPKFKDYFINNETIQLFYPQALSEKIGKYMGLYRTDKIVISGGDPLSKYNIFKVKILLQNLYANSTNNVCIYTGKDIEYVKKAEVKGFKFIKCGKYIEELKQESIKTDEYIQFASSNQGLYDSNYNLLSENGRYYFERS